MASSSVLMVRGAASTLVLRALDVPGAQALQQLFDAAEPAELAEQHKQQPGRRQDASQPAAAQQQQDGDAAGCASHFDTKTDKGSAEL